MERFQLAELPALQLSKSLKISENEICLLWLLIDSSLIYK